jgi:hypothetical protein
MKSTNWKDTAELIGIAAIVGSLIFVGLQMHQTHEIALSAAYQAREASSIERLTAQAGSTEYTSGVAKLYRRDFDDVSPEERVSLEHFFIADMVMFENRHYQYELGYLPADHWARNFSEMWCMLSLPFYREIIKPWEFRASFQIVVDEAVAKAISNPSKCWTMRGDFWTASGPGS